jgi:hypothetical protein
VHEEALLQHVVNRLREETLAHGVENTNESWVSLSHTVTALSARLTRHARGQGGACTCRMTSVSSKVTIPSCFHTSD